jgi:thymidylate synthase (FAD)
MVIWKPSHEIIYPVGDEIVTQMKRIERMGRIAYKSEDKITDESWKPFVRMIAKRGHGSVLEHGFMQVVFLCDRGVSHELVRHRLMSPTQESTRYCSYNKDKFDNSIAVVDPDFSKVFNPENTEMDVEHSEKLAKVYEIWEDAMKYDNETYLKLIELGVPAQFARSVLPNSLKTEIAVTANFREWQHIFRIRGLNEAAHPQMREMILPLYEECKELIPEVFDLDDDITME